MNENWTAEDRKQSTELLEQGCQTHHHVSWNGSRCKTGFWNLTSNTPLPWTGAGHHQQRERNAWEERTNHARRARQHNACQRKIRTMKRNAKKDVTQTRQKKWERKRKPKSTEWRIFPAASCCDDLFFHVGYFSSLMNTLRQEISPPWVCNWIGPRLGMPPLRLK